MVPASHPFFPLPLHKKRFFTIIHILISLLKKTIPSDQLHLNSDHIHHSSRTISFKNTFFRYCANEWNNLKADKRNAKSLNILKKFIISGKKEYPLFSVFSVYDPLGVKLLTRLSPLCTCVAEVETTKHFLLHCQLYSTHRSEH